MNTLIEKADLLYAKGCCEDAVALLSDHLRRNSAQIDVITRLSEILVDAGRHAKALQIICNSTLDRNSSLFLLLSGICHLGLGDVSRAEAVVDRLLDQNRHEPGALSLKGHIALHSQAEERAERLFQEAIEKDPYCAIAWSGLASIRLRQNKPLDYFECARKAFSNSPASREIAIQLHASSLTVQGFHQAEEDLKIALTTHRMNRRLRFLLIDLLLRQSKFSEAMSEIESSMVDFDVDSGFLEAAISVREKLQPTGTATATRPWGRVSLCMIVKNEQINLARSLKSAKPIVDEIIVVDTGSSDHTKEIALAFGAQVYDFKWGNDFSKARNFSIEKATGDWIFVLDADEAISDKDYRNLNHILALSPHRPIAYRIQTRNYSNQVNTVGFVSNRGEYAEEEGIGWFPSDKVRLFKKDPRIQFVHPVHELVEPSLHNIHIQDCPIVVHHYGTLKVKQALEKTKNYRKLSRKKMNLNRTTASAIKECAIQAGQLGKYSEAIDLWKRFIRLEPRSAEAYVNIGTACWNLGRYMEAVSFAEIALRLDPAMKEATFNMAYSLLLVGNEEKAKSILEGLLKERPDYLSAQFLLCVTYVCLGDRAQAESIFRKLKELPVGDYIGESFHDITKRFLAASRISYAQRTVEAAIDFGCANLQIRTLLKSCTAAA